MRRKARPGIVGAQAEKIEAAVVFQRRDDTYPHLVGTLQVGARKA
jgi:hypothetical protein